MDLPALSVLRTSQADLADLVRELQADVLGGPSYHSWSIAQVLSHLGSQAEIFGLRLSAGRDGSAPPGQAEAQPIWAAWDAKAPERVRDDSVAANQAFIASVDALTEEQARDFGVALFGTDVDLAGLVGMRLNEHVVHTWDIAVALDPAARLCPDAVPLLLASLPGTAAWSGKPTDGEPYVLEVRTTDPDQVFSLRVGDSVALEPGPAADAGSTLGFPAEALVRLVYGRLDEAHTPPVDQRGPRGTADLRRVFLGFCFVSASVPTCAC